MPIYKVKYHTLDPYSSSTLYKLLPYRNHIVKEFIEQIETFIEDYRSIVKSSLEIPQANKTAENLNKTADDINTVLNDLNTLPTFGIPLLKAKASFSGLGYLPAILDRTRSDLMHIRDIINWTTDNIQGETNNDESHRLKILIRKTAKLYKQKFDKNPEINTKAEFMQIMRIIFAEIDIKFSELTIKDEIENIYKENLSVKY